MKIVFLVAVVAITIEKLRFSYSIAAIVREISSFMKTMQLVKPNYLSNNRVNR